MSKLHWKSQYKVIESASQFHEEMRHLFMSHPTLMRLSCYQEINVKDLIDDYPYTNHHYDWYIKELGVVIELHGQQHYKLSNRGKAMADAIVDFRRQKDRDNSKKTAAITNGFNFIEIPYKYKGKLSYELLLRLISEN